MEACFQLTPQFEAGDLYLDLESGVPSHDCGSGISDDTIWISESTIGGGGVIEEIQRKYVEDPRRFFLLVEVALGMSDFEVVDEELLSILELVQSSQEVAECFEAIRSAESNEALNAARNSLMRVLSRNDILLTHSVMTSLNARILRPGTSAQTDMLFLKLLKKWHELESQDCLGVEIDARVFTYLASKLETSDVSSVLQSISGDGHTLLSHSALLYSLLWPRGSAIRKLTSGTYNPFANLPDGDPKLLRDAMMVGLHIIYLTDLDWRQQVDDTLADYGIARIATPSGQRDLLRTAIVELATQPIETGFLRLYPYVARAQRVQGYIIVTLHIREAIQ
jgi:hypothetical protein